MPPCVKHEVNEGFLVSSMLYALIVPATTPLWQVALGIIFGVVIGKEVFGGTGKNFLNPALTGPRVPLFRLSRADCRAMRSGCRWTGSRVRPRWRFPPLMGSRSLPPAA